MKGVTKRMGIKIAMLVVFFAVMVGIGIYCRRHATDVKGFVLGGRSVGPWLTAFAYGTSYFSAVIFVGYAGQFGWKYGVATTWIGVGNALIGSLLAWAVLGRRTRIMTQHLNAATMPEFFGRRFGSKALKIGASLIIFIFLIPYTASLYNGLSRLFAMSILGRLYGLHHPHGLVHRHLCHRGGYMATAINDFIQGIIMLIGIIVIIAAVLNTQGGFTSAMNALANVSDPAVSASPGAFTSLFGPDPLGLLGVVILTSLGTWGLPQMVQKFYAIKSESAVKKGMIISTVFAMVRLRRLLFSGGFGRLFADQVNIAADGYDAIIPTMLSGLSDLVIALAVILVLSASMSTLSSLVMASSSTLTIDFLKDNIVKDMSEKKQLRSIRVLIVVFIFISALIAIIQYKGNITFIAQLMGISWGALAGAFLAPFLYGLYWKRTSPAACAACFLFGCGNHGPQHVRTVSCFPAFCSRRSTAVPSSCWQGSSSSRWSVLFGKVKDEAAVEEAFSCYEKKVQTPQRMTLGDDR